MPGQLIQTMDASPLGHISGASSNAGEETDRLHQHSFTNSNSHTTLIGPDVSSPESIRQASPSPCSTDDSKTDTEVEETAVLIFPDSFEHATRPKTKSISPSLYVGNGYDTGVWHRFSYWAADAWLYDFLAWLVSFACFIGIVVTLSTHRDQPIPEWPFDITINALVSALSAVMGSSLLVPVSSTIGQSKWSWIGKRSRKLEDIAAYDEASRGPWGSLVLLLKKGPRESVSFGAVITILALSIPPFLQQTTAVVLEDRQADMANATLHGLNWWAEGLRTESGTRRVKDDMVMAINRGLFFDGNSSDPFLTGALRPRPQCPTGNCSFPAFESLAVCSECADISQFLTMHNSSSADECKSNTQKYGNYSADYWSFGQVGEGCARWSLPNGYRSDWLDSGSHVLMSTSSSRSPLLLRPGLSILNLTAVSPCWYFQPDAPSSHFGKFQACLREHEEAKTQAQECNLHWCVHKYESEMTNGVLRENIISTTHSGDYAPGFMYSFYPPNSSTSYLVIPGMAGMDLGRNIIYPDMEVGVIKGKFSVHRDATELVSAYLQSELEGFTGVDDGYTTRGQIGKTYVRRLYMVNPGRYRRDYNARNFDMSPMFETMALSMTTALRTPRTQLDRADYDVTKDGFEPNDDSWDLPTVWQSIETRPIRLVPVLRVRWAWVSLPAALEILTLLLLCYMVRCDSQRRLPIWKSSTLPLILLGSEMHDAVGDNIPRHIVDMEMLAKGVSVEPDIGMGRALQQPDQDTLEDGWASDVAGSRNI